MRLYASSTTVQVLIRLNPIVAFIPPFILQAYFQFPFHVAARFSFLSVYLFLSGGITISATTLIIIRIKNVSGVGKYSYVIEALIQSGVMYSLSTLASSTILVIATSRLDNVALVQISTYASVFAVPIAVRIPNLYDINCKTYYCHHREFP